MMGKRGIHISAVTSLRSGLVSQNHGLTGVVPPKATDVPSSSYTAGVIAVQQSTVGSPIMREDFVTCTGPMMSRI